MFFFNNSLNSLNNQSDETVSMFTKAIERLEKVNEKLNDLMYSASEKATKYHNLAESADKQYDNNLETINKIKSIIN